MRENEASGNTRFPTKCGPVAQLGARFHGMEEVVGSNPTRSTIKFQPIRDYARRKATVIPTVQDFIDEARRYRTVAEKALDQVSDDALNRVLAPDGNSMAML